MPHVDFKATVYLLPEEVKDAEGDLVLAVQKLLSGYHVVIAHEAVIAADDDDDAEELKPSADESLEVLAERELEEEG